MIDRLASPEHWPGEIRDELGFELREELAEVLSSYHIPALEAESLLLEAMTEALYGSKGGDDFRRRSLHSLRRKCCSFWETRSWNLATEWLDALSPNEFPKETRGETESQTRDPSTPSETEMDTVSEPSPSREALCLDRFQRSRRWWRRATALLR